MIIYLLETVIFSKEASGSISLQVLPLPALRTGRKKIHS
jgi:hypothetical protein